MRYEYIKTFGRLMRGLQTHRLAAAFTSPSFIRVPMTHEVFKEDEANFEAIIDYLATTYEAITPAKFFRIMRKEEPLAGRYFVMTFDDGLMSSYHAIKRTLSKYNLKAMVFVPTQILELKSVEEMKRFTWQNIGFHKGEEPPATLREETYLMMGTKELLDLHHDGHAVLPHTHSHKRMIEVTDERTADEEIIKPKKILQELLQAEMPAFAIPVGTERVVSGFSFPYLQREYEFCFSALPGKNTPTTNPHVLHRDCMNADYDLDHVRNMEDGVFDVYYGYKSARLKQAFHVD